jgi:catechol 2,3-dioxygenase-like lactoylglutathione lyase family enzyme
METFIAEPANAMDDATETGDTEIGAMNRRQFCERMALAATTYAAGTGAAYPAAAQGFRPIGINHISYACADYRKARDFYTTVLGMQNLASADDGHQTRLMFGPETARGGTFLIPRNGRITTNAKAVVDHIGYAISDWNKMTVRAALEAKRLQVSASDAGSLHVYDPFDYDVQLTGAPDASSGAAASSAAPAPRIAAVTHISYTCSDLKRTADWYSRIFNLDPIDKSASRVTLGFGTAGDAPHLVFRTPDPRPAAHDGRIPLASKALVNHIAYTIGEFDKEHVRAELKRLGYPKPLQDGEHSFHIVDPNGFDVQISGVQMTALGG